MSGPLRVLIVDDEAPARNRMRDLLSDCAGTMDVTVVGEAANGRAALAFLEETPADVVLLDIHMPQMDGLELAHHLRALDTPPAVVFTTAHDEHAIRAFELHAVDYLLKPIRLARLQEALSRVRDARAVPPEALAAARGRPRAYVSAQERGKVSLIPIEDVLYFRAELKYVTARTAEREFLLEESLTRLEQEYADRFVRVHRSFLVAKAAIRGFERAPAEGGEGGWFVLLRRVDDRIPVSRRQQHVIRDVGREGS
ncbi:MAG TPA: response regulator [Burkholderiales bacterium]|nr:response regulator [Burkholderiales bacterium]